MARKPRPRLARTSQTEKAAVVASSIGHVPPSTVPVKNDQPSSSAVAAMSLHAARVVAPPPPRSPSAQQKHATSPNQPETATMWEKVSSQKWTRSSTSGPGPSFAIEFADRWIPWPST